MKPLNLDNRPCSPISSNCVIWQGPDIPCIKLCTGDTVSDVIFKLATELCAIMDQLNVTNYDLTCLGITACPPNDFQALIQLLITKICELNGIPTTETKVSGCPDCVVSVAECLRQLDPTLPATMQLIDYVQMIANKICGILEQLDVINNQITNLDNRVTVLENTPPPTFTLPSIDTGCLATYITGNPASATIDIVLDTLLNNGTAGYCALIAATDLPANILSAVATQCITGTDNSLANPGDTFSSAYGPYTGFGTWNNTPVTAADAINNLWIAVCDIYNYLSNFPVTEVVAGDNITVDTVTVGNVTTYTINNIGLDYFYAQVTIGGPRSCNTAPATIPAVANAPGKTVAFGGASYTVGPVQDVNEYNYMDSNGTVVNIAGTTGGTNFVITPPPSNFLTVDNLTGIFSITQSGEYFITMSMYLKANSSNSAYWKTTGADGRFDIGICSTTAALGVNSQNIFTGASKSIVANMDSNIILTAQCTVQLGPSNQVIFRMLNLTGEDYAGGSYSGADTIRVGFVKIRDL